MKYEQSPIARYRILSPAEDAASPSSAIFYSRDQRDDAIREGLLTVVSPRVYRLKSNRYAVRGFSAKYGEHMALIRGSMFGSLLVSEVTKRPMEAMA